MPDGLALTFSAAIGLIHMRCFFAFVLTVGAFAQTETPLRFEAASIKPSKDGGGKGGIDVLPGGGLRMSAATIKGLIALAYGVREEQITGGPRWMSSDSYNIVATAEKSENGDTANVAGPGTQVWKRMQLRLRTLLEERCKLALRKDSKESQGYAMVIAKGGFKLEPSTSHLPAGTMRSRGRIDGRNGTMKMLSEVLTGMLQRPVEDRTGLDGGYDYKLEYSQDDGETNAGAPSVFTALQETLGLKLESARVAVETIAIERVEKPSAN